MKTNILLFSATVITAIFTSGCTTGSKTNVTSNYNYYSASETKAYVATSEQIPTYEHPHTMPIVFANNEPSLYDLSKQIGTKLCRKIVAGYNAN